MEILNTTLNKYAISLCENTPRDIGSFRAFNSDWELMFSLSDLSINCSENKSWNKSVQIRFDPSKELEDHKKISYVHLKFHLGFTVDKQFYWLLVSRDQTIRKEYIIEQLKPKSLLTLVHQKINCIDKIVAEHFIDRVEKHFKA